MNTSTTPALENLPEIWSVDRFVYNDDVFYASRTENRVELYRVVGTTEIARVLYLHDAVIYDETICRSVQYDSQYRTIDLYHHMAGRVASLRTDRILDEPAVLLEEVDRR